MNRFTDTKYDFSDISEVKKITCKEELRVVLVKLKFKNNKLLSVES